MEYIAQTFGTPQTGTVTGSGPVTLFPSGVPTGANAILLTNGWNNTINPQNPTAIINATISDANGTVGVYQIGPGAVFAIPWTQTTTILTEGASVTYIARAILVGDTVANALLALITSYTSGSRASIISYNATMDDFAFSIFANYEYENDPNLQVPYTTTLTSPTTLYVVDPFLNPVEGVTAVLYNNGASNGYIQLNVAQDAFSVGGTNQQVELRIYQEVIGNRLLVLAGALTLVA